MKVRTDPIDVEFFLYLEGNTIRDALTAGLAKYHTFISPLFNEGELKIPRFLNLCLCEKGGSEPIASHHFHDSSDIHLLDMPLDGEYQFSIEWVIKNS